MRNRRLWYEKRPDLRNNTPVHITVRVRDGTVKLRYKRAFRIVRGGIVALADKIRFRVIEYSVQGNHLHMIAEGDDTYAVSRAMRSLSIRIARRINQLMGVSGRRIDKRYHMRVLRTPHQVRMALAYVLNNYRRHAAQGKRRCPRGWVDPCSSAIWFPDWMSRPKPARDPCPDLPRGTVPARSDLLRILWKALGLLELEHVPGPWLDTAFLNRS